MSPEKEKERKACVSMYACVYLSWEKKKTWRQQGTLFKKSWITNACDATEMIYVGEHKL